MLDEKTLLAGRHPVAVSVNHFEAMTEGRLGRRAGFNRQQLDADRVGYHRPAALGLPVVVDHRHTERLRRPLVSWRIERFAGSVQNLERTNVGVAHPLFGNLRSARSAVGAVKT